MPAGKRTQSPAMKTPGKALCGNSSSNDINKSAIAAYKLPGKRGSSSCGGRQESAAGAEKKQAAAGARVLKDVLQEQMMAMAAVKREVQQEKKGNSRTCSNLSNKSAISEEEGRLYQQQGQEGRNSRVKNVSKLVTHNRGTIRVPPYQYRHYPGHYHNAIIHTPLPARLA